MKKPHGHYCRICGEYKANEKFSGSGHTAHICKACAKLPLLERNEREMITKIDRIAGAYRLSTEHLDWLTKKSKDHRYSEAAKHAKAVLDEYEERQTEYRELKKQERLQELIVAETERLIIREFTLDDAEELQTIMGKPEVMYAWEHSFTVQQTRDWIKKQIKRYKEDGYGYFAVIREDNGKLVGQAGIMESDIDGEPITELGYIFDNEVWGNGYATEAAEALIDLAFEQYGIDCLYCTIRPDNAASIRVAERLGFKHTGEYTKLYQGKEMPHLIYTLTYQEG